MASISAKVSHPARPPVASWRLAADPRGQSGGQGAVAGRGTRKLAGFVCLVAAATSGVAAEARTPKDSGTHGKAKPRMEQRSQAEATRAKAIEKASANERTRLDKPTAQERTEAGVRVRTA